MSVISATRSVVAIVLVGIMVACGGGDGPISPTGPASLSLSPASDIRLSGIGQTAQLTAAPKDESGNDVSAQVTWTSTNEAVATVVSTGATTATVTARGFGSAKIRATAGSVFQEITVTVQQQQFNVNATSTCSSPDLRNYKIEAQSAHLLIVSGTDNPPGGFTTADYEAFAATFESLVYPVVTQNFGVPADIDGNGKVIAFFTRAVNELTPPNSQSVVGGFFFGRDLFPKVASGGLAACAGSNQAELFYLLVPDPTGVVNGNVRSLEQVRRLTIGVIGHEFQHLINSSRRLFINQGATWPETVYVEEGLSHIAEELIFYEASGGLTPKMNIGIETLRTSQTRLDAFNSYMISNAARFSTYLKDPSGNSPYQKDDDLATRGAIWSFLRYLADRGTPGTPFVEPACGASVTLAVGGRCALEGSGAAQFDVTAGGSLGEFTIVAFAKDLPIVSVTQPGSLTTTASATSTVGVSGPPNPWSGTSGAQFSTFGTGSLGGAAASLPLDHSFHAKLRGIERRELPERVAGARAAYSLTDRSGARMYSAPGSPSMAAIVVEAVWGQLVNANDTGMANLKGRFGQDITGAARDWTVANYVDDIGLTVPSQYMHPSWNFRTLLPALSSNGASMGNPGTYPLQVQNLTSSVTVTLADGGSAYYRFGVAAGGTSTVRFTVGGGPPPSNLKLVLVRTK
ncbi:MAG: Ig-like domain-containing protein [Gemmatimonadaceae bacterium]|nr:Ig-like domain-containing protein [Gemmatimonadaceae bacterium]